MSSQPSLTALRSGVSFALSATTPAANLTDELRRANQECVRLAREVESAQTCVMNLQAWLDQHAPLLADSEQENMDALMEQFTRSASEPCPNDRAQKLRGEFARITAAHRQMRDFIRPARERKAMLAQAVALEARAAVLGDIIEQREDRKAVLMAPLLMLEGTVELSDTDSTSSKLRNARGELLIGAASLREQVRDCDNRAVLGVVGASAYQPELLTAFSERFRSLFDVTEPRGQAQ